MYFLINFRAKMILIYLKIYFVILFINQKKLNIINLYY